jgi:hypothetical protein
VVADRNDLEAAIELRGWVESRSRARRRARTITAAFGWQRLGRKARTVIGQALGAAGIDATPSFEDCRLEDWLELTIVGDPIESRAAPTQLVTYLEHNWTGAGDSGPVGQWLRCLASTAATDRQLVWNDNSIAGLVTFAGWIRPGPGFYEGWGSLQRLPSSVGRQELLDDPRTRSRFDSRGIRALQGSPIRLTPEIASAIAEMAGGLPATVLPLDEPDYDEDPVLWVGLHGLSPEAHIEAAVASQKRLWRRLGFPDAPRRQRRLGVAGRVDLIAGDVVGEAKRAVTLHDGPAQIERYLEYLAATGADPGQLRGVLLQCAADASDAVIERIVASPFNLQLWSVLEGRRWTLERLA